MIYIYIYIYVLCVYSYVLFDYKFLQDARTEKDVSQSAGFQLTL